MTRPLLTAAALAVALPAAFVAVPSTILALGAWRVAFPAPPKERLYGSAREWLRGVLRGQW